LLPQFQSTSDLSSREGLLRSVLETPAKIGHGLGGPGTAFNDRPTVKTKTLIQKMRNRGSRISCFLRTGYYSTGERVNPDIPDDNFENHFKVYRFMRQFAIDKDVIDIGCGTGYGTAHLAEMAKSIVGVDISEPALKWASKRYPGVRYILMDAQRLQFPDLSFDLIVSTENFEHLADQKGHVKELARILRPDGLCFVATPNPEMFTDSHNPYHTKENSFDELMKLLSDQFQNVSILENMMEPRTKEGQAMRRKRREEGQVGAVTLRNVDTTWLHNTHSFFCFCREPFVSRG
jgi:ubiquinone/menaquinone biosynthesis C-methylase UbiE